MFHRLCTLFLLLFGLALPALAQTQPPTDDYQNEREERDPAPLEKVFDAARTGGRIQFIVLTRPGQAGAVTDALIGQGARLLRVRPLGNLGRTVLVFDPQRLDLPRARALVDAVAPGSSADFHGLYRYAGGPRLYAAALIGANPAGCPAPGVRIGIIDGPVNPNHPALAGARVAVHSVLAGSDAATDTAHGTAVTALIAGTDSSGALAGMAPGALVHAVAAFAREPRGPGADVERIAAAIDILAGLRVDVVNMSFAGPRNEVLDDLLALAAARGMVLIAAAGNDGSDDAAWPAAARPVIAVTAVDAAARHYRSANTGAHIDFAAPGVDLYIAKPKGGGYASGTSYAAPIVTALAAHAVRRGARGAAAVSAALRRNARDLGTPGRDPLYGWGLVGAPDC